jgi:transposase
MSKFKHFLGIDVSKEYFDAVVILDSNKQTKNHNQFSNNYKGIQALRKWLKEQGATCANTLVCLEHTGMYGKLIIKYLISFKFDLWVEMSFRIIRSMGIQRGKNDKIDAERIAIYAMKNVEEACIYKAPRKDIDKIRALLSLRDKLTRMKNALSVTIKELKSFDLETAKLSEKLQKSTLKSVNLDLQKIEEQLDSIVSQDPNLSNLYSLSSSVIGVGKVTALYLICFTNEFSMYTSPRQLACYAGVVPFEHTSGKSVRSKPKVHHMANKKLKTLLTMCAMTSILSDPELKEYYNRRVAEGKNKWLVINNIKNKIVHRVCACIRDNRAFEKREVA